jgi:hypothetical protein
MRAVLLGFVLLTLRGASLAAEEKPHLFLGWEYRVVTKEQLLDLGKNDLATGLNVLGREGWELTVVDGAYIFKRPRNLIEKQREDLKAQIAVIESDLTQMREHVTWAERMLKKGYMTERQVEAERTQLRRIEMALERARRDLQTLTPAAEEPKEKERKSDK